MRAFLNSKLIVTNPADSFYSNMPNPPLGVVLLNYTEGDGKAINAATLVPASAWAALFLCRYGSREAIAKAGLIVDNLITNIIEATVNGKSMYFQSIHYFNETSGQWEKRMDDGYCEVYIRDLLLSAYALTALYLRLGDETYKAWALKLMESIHKEQSAFAALCGSDLPAYLSGAFPEFYLRSSAEADFNPVNWRVPLHLGDIACDMAQKAMTAFGNAQVTAEGENYSISDINDNYHSFIRTNCILSQRGVMAPTGLPYMYMAPVEGSGDFTGKNLSPVYNQWGDFNWTSDTILWSVLGIAKNEGIAARSLLDQAKTLVISGFFSDVYTYAGLRDNEFPHLATQATALYLEARRLTGGGF